MEPVEILGPFSSDSQFYCIGVQDFEYELLANGKISITKIFYQSVLIILTYSC